MGRAINWTDVLILALALYGLVSGAAAVVGVVRRFLTGDRQAPGVLVLVRNQEAHIEGFLRAVSGMLRVRPWRGRGPEWLVVVDLASTDETVRILERLSSQDPAIRFVRMPEERVGQALEVSLKLLRGGVAVTVDLRGKVDSRAILHTLEAMW